MKQRINFKTIYLIATITVGLLGLAIGSTYAIFTTSAEINNPISLSTTLTSDDDVFDVIDIVIEPYDTITKTIKIVNSSNSTVNFAIWYLNNFSDNSVDFGINNVPSGTLNVSSNESRIVNIRNKTSNQITITIGVASSKKSITLADSMVIYPNQTLPENIINQQAAKYITNLYETSAKTTVTNNSINYNYATNVSLMNDRKGSSSIGIDSGNIRYYGADPNNYVYFNCNSYNSQNSSSCEKWRIIGVFDGKVKLMRNEQIGKYSWNTKSSNWSSGTLMAQLNPGYENWTGGSLYYNSQSGTCYNGADNSKTSCDFTNAGIKTEETRGKIVEITWYLGGWETSEIYSNQMYDYERGTAVYSGNNKTWTGKVALPYPSDYGYAVDFNKCSNTLKYYDNSTCTSNNWMKSIITNSGKNTGWFLTPRNDISGSAWFVLSSGCANYNSSGFVYFAYGVVPTLFLNSTETIYKDKATGSQNNPYKLTP